MFLFKLVLRTSVACVTSRYGFRIIILCVLVAAAVVYFQRRAKKSDLHIDKQKVLCLKAC